VGTFLPADMQHCAAVPLLRLQLKLLTY